MRTKQDHLNSLHPLHAQQRPQSKTPSSIYWPALLSSISSWLHHGQSQLHLNPSMHWPKNPGNSLVNFSSYDVTQLPCILFCTSTLGFVLFQIYGVTTVAEMQGLVPMLRGVCSKPKAKTPHFLCLCVKLEHTAAALKTLKLVGHNQNQEEADHLGKARESL